LDTDVAYENFVRQIAGGALDAPAAEPLPRSIARDQRPRPAPPCAGKADRGVAEQDTQRKAAQPAGGAEWGVEKVEEGDGMSVIKLVETIKKHKVLTTIFIIVAFVVPLVVIQLLFECDSGISL